MRRARPAPDAPGECTTVTAPVPADGELEAIADDEALIGECRESNDSARSMADCLG